jgi:uncharacterized protein YqjF (DUF2071 family)
MIRVFGDDPYGPRDSLRAVAAQRAGLRELGHRPWPVPGTSAFGEVNVRTYVTHEGRGGVYFLSLDAKDEIAVTLGRRMYGLPYLHAHMTMHTDTAGAVEIRSERHYSAAQHVVAWSPVPVA